MKNCELDKKDSDAVCEAEYLLRSPENARKLLQALTEAEQGIGKKIILKKADQDT